MLKNDRLKKIIDIINEQQSVSVQFLVEQLSISDMTVRRYLSELDQAGKIIRVHGGALSIDQSRGNVEFSHFDKLNKNKDKKLAIARYATSLIKESDTIYLGPGTTLELMAELLADKKITVLTNSIAVFDRLKISPTIKILLCGGQYRSITGSFCGSLTNQTLSGIHPDKAFFSVNGIHGLKALNHDVEDGQTQKLALDNSTETYCLADSSKLFQTDNYEFYDLKYVDALITDNEIPEIVQKNYEAELNLIIAE